LIFPKSLTTVEACRNWK